MEVMVSFIEKVDGAETFILTMGVDVYPTYKQNDVIFLEITDRQDDVKSIRETMFLIKDVHHSVRQIKNTERRTKDNFFGISHHLGMEVYVVRMDD